MGFFDKGPKPGKLVDETPLPNVEVNSRRQEKGVFSEFMADSRRAITIGVGALTVFLSGVAYAREKAPEAPISPDHKQTQRQEAQMEDVMVARANYENFIRLVFPEKEIADKAMKLLDEMLAEIEDPNQKLQAIELYRQTIENRVAEKEATKNQQVLDLKSENFDGKIIVRRGPGGRISVLFEGQVLKGGLYQIAAAKYLKPDFMNNYRAGGNVSEDMMRIQMRALLLMRYDEAIAQAEAEGKQDLADGIREMRNGAAQQIEADFGDVLK